LPPCGDGRRRSRKIIIDFAPRNPFSRRIQRDMNMISPRYHFRGFPAKRGECQ
jgi:hypothetical protein